MGGLPDSLFWLLPIWGDNHTPGWGYDPCVHLSYRDVAVDNPLHSRIISLLLKTEQVGRGVKVILGRTVHYLCPEAAALDYLGSRGSDPAPLFRWSNGRLLTRTRFLEKGRVVLQHANLPAKNFEGQFSYWGGHHCCGSGRGGFNHTSYRSVEEFGFLCYIQASLKTLAGVLSVSGQGLLVVAGIS